MKACERCGSNFSRPKKISDSQWEGRKFCGKKCSGMRRIISDREICDEYMSGKTAIDVGLKFGLSGTHVTRILKDNSINIRSAGESISIGLSKPDVKEKLSISSSNRVMSERSKDKLRSRTGPKNHNWGGGITQTVGGYLAYTDSVENGDRAGRLVHRVIMEEYIGMKLPTNIHVHHKDRNKKNNDFDNLELMTASEHMRHHIECGDLDWR